MQGIVSSRQWQHRTHKIVALAVIIIGLTMMISTIPQCIYIGVISIMLSVGWLTWMKVKEQKIAIPNGSPQPHGNLSPVLFLVSSQHFTQRTRGPSLPDPNDKPPSYDQILKLDGLPPDYVSALVASPPSYEDIINSNIKWPVTIPIEIGLGSPAMVHTTGISTSCTTTESSYDSTSLNTISDHVVIPIDDTIKEKSETVS